MQIPISNNHMIIAKSRIAIPQNAALATTTNDTTH